ncbi:MAG: CoA-binding protein [Chloroflexota bacterium]
MANPWRDDDYAQILSMARTVAVVGLSSDPFRPSYGVARYLQMEGFRIIPVNPHEREILGERAYPDLPAIPDRVDVVDVFRRSDCASEVIDQAIRIGAKAVWLQAGIWALEAGERARQAGLRVVMSHCMATELRRQRVLVSAE